MQTSNVEVGTSLPVSATNPIRPYYLKPEVAGLLRVSPRTIDNLVQSKQLKCIHVGRSIRFRPSDVEAFMRRDHPTQTESIN